MPRASFSHRAELTATSGAAWEALQKAETWSGIGPVDEIWDAVYGEGETLEGFQWSAHVGPTKYKGSAVVALVESPHHMKLNLDSPELSGSLIADLDDDGTPRITVTLEVVAKGTLASLFFPLVAEAIGRGLPEQVEEFAKGLQAGPNAV